jgi:hypothetical protein
MGSPERAPGSAEISELIGVTSDLSLRLMGDKSPKAKSKQAAQKQTKVDTESQKKKDAASARQIAKTKK